MNVGAPELIIIVIMLAFAVIPIWGLIDAATRPAGVWNAAGQSKVLWIILQFVLGILGALIYFLAIRPRLQAIEEGRRPA